MDDAAQRRIAEFEAALAAANARIAELEQEVAKLLELLSRNSVNSNKPLYFLLPEGPLRDLDALLDLVRAKFDVGPHRLGLAAAARVGARLSELSRMIRPVTLKAMAKFFEELAQDLIRSEANSH